MVLVVRGELTEVIVREQDFVHHAPAADRLAVVATDLLPHPADLVGRADAAHRAVHARAERRHPVVRLAPQLGGAAAAPSRPLVVGVSYNTQFGLRTFQSVNSITANSCLGKLYSLKCVHFL